MGDFIAGMDAATAGTGDPHAVDASRIASAVVTALRGVGPAYGACAEAEAEAVIAAFAGVGSEVSYGSLPGPAWQVEATSPAKGGPQARAIILKRVLGGLMLRSLQSAALDRVPASMRGLLYRQYLRMLDDMNAQADDFYTLHNDLFLKDLGMARLVLLPAGAELVEMHAGIPRSVLFKVGVRNMPGAVAFCMLTLGGLRPLCQFHADIRSLEDFNPEGWRRTYLRLADLLELNPEIRGVFGTAWFYDPKLAEISPHLVYLREVREHAGARNFCIRPTPGATSNALARSKTRRRLYDAGEYSPTTNYLVWGRRDLLAWAQKNGGIR